MGTFSLWHWLIVVVVVIGIPSLVIWLIVRAARGARPAAGSRLQELDQFRQRGLITQEEYERKRAELARQL